MIDQGAIVAWFVMKIENRGELYFLCGVNPALAKNNSMQHKFVEFYTIDEISLNNEAVDLANQQHAKTLHCDNDLSEILYGAADKSRKKLFQVGFKEPHHRLMSVEDALRLFYSIDANYLKIDNYIISKNDNYSKSNQVQEAKE